MECSQCGHEMVYMFSGERSREHEEDYPAPQSLYFCAPCNVLGLATDSYESWWVPAYRVAPVLAGTGTHD